jgi:16S rRNA (cytosine967-C5)-methyltransferase
VSRCHSYLNSAEAIIHAYNGEEPFASFLKKYFATNKKFGSKDRKQVSHLCYCYFRLGKAMMNMPVQERILTGLFLCSQEPNEILSVLKPVWNDKVGLVLKDKYSICNIQYSRLPVFSWNDELNAGIDFTAFNESHFIQPDLFLRTRPRHEETVKQKLKHAQVEYSKQSSTCIALPNSTKVDTIIDIDKEAVIQDYSSQRVGELLKHIKQELPGSPLKVWDCCAASGGKSILAKDILGDIELTVSDVRESILHNLKKRFAAAGIKKYQSTVMNLADSKPKSSIFNQKYSIIICDAPCTGSGTWGRTPEQLFYFEKEKIIEYASLQKKIATNAVTALTPGGYFLYITCSVFKEENEEAVEMLKQQCGMQLIKQEIFIGYTKKADTLFAALLQKTN